MIGLEGRNEIALNVLFRGVDEAVAKMNYLANSISKNMKSIRGELGVISGFSKDLETLEMQKISEIHPPDLSSEFEDALGKAVPLKDQLTGVENSIKGLEGHASDLGKEFSDMQKGMAAPSRDMSKNISSIEEGFEQTGRHASDTAAEIEDVFGPQAVGKARKFKMELLSVMFFGMAIQKTFMGFLQPAMEAYGVFDIWKDMLLVTFIPIMDSLFPMFLEFTDFFMNLPEPVQFSIGAIGAIIAVLGTLLMTFGMVGLGIDGMSMAFPGLTSSLTTATKGIEKSISALATPRNMQIVVGVALALQMYKTVKDLKGGNFDFGTALWDTLVTSFLAYKGLSMFVSTAPYAGAFSIALAATIGISFLLTSDFKYTLRNFMEAIWNEFAMAWNASSLRALKKLDLIYRAPPVTKEELGGAMGVLSPGGSIGSVSDFVMTGGRMYKTHPDDTVVGTKGGMGDTYNITVNVTGNGMNDRNLAEKIGEVVTAQLRNATIR